MSQSAPSNYAAAPALGYAAAGPAGYAGIAAAPAGYAVAEAAPVAAIGYAAPVTAVQETLHAGPAVAHTEVHQGVVGHRTVQVTVNRIVVIVVPS